MPDWERYQFLRYYLPGFLFITYLAILLIPAMENIPVSTTIDQFVGIFGAVIIASPVIGYLIYSPYNNFYEYVSSHCNRPALVFIQNAEFAKRSERAYYTKRTDSFALQKELIDLTLYIDYHPKDKANGTEKSDATLSHSVLSVLQNQLNNFSARVVCGFFTPIFSLVIAGIIGLVLMPTFFSLDKTAVYFSILLIILISGSLLVGARGVLKEAFVLENYIIRSRKSELKIILDKIFTKEESENQKTEIR